MPPQACALLVTECATGAESAVLGAGCMLYLQLHASLSGFDAILLSERITCSILYLQRHAFSFCLLCLCAVPACRRQVNGAHAAHRPC
jgi:hypothetical protein